MPSTLWTAGLRRSQSIMRTDAPNCDKEIAVFTTVVVLPSPGCPLVIRIVLGGLSADDRRTEVRRTRYASATDERVSSASNCSPLNPFVLLSERPPLVCFEPFVLAFSALCLHPRIAGMTLRAGSWANRLTSSTVLTVLSRYSRKKTNPTPAIRLVRKPMSTVRARLGATGDVGTCGGSTIFSVLCCSCSVILAWLVLWRNSV